VRLHLADGVPLLRPEEQVFTGRMILYHLGELTLRIGNVTDPPTVQITRGVQLHLLDLLGIEVTQTRWTQT
jgi:hypothetical protein